MDFSESETIIPKYNLEQLDMDHGVVIDLYLANNGIFATKPFSGTYMNMFRKSTTVEQMTIIIMVLLSEAFT